MKDLLANSFRGKKVLVTGHTGFKGAWLCLWLEKLGAQITGYSLPTIPDPNAPNLFAATNLRDRLHHVEGDIRDLDALRRTLHDSNAEVIFHLAAQSLVRPSYEDPKTTYDTNVGGTVNLMEAIRTTPAPPHSQVRVFINVTSDKCYENREWTWGYRENDPMGGHDPYSSSKGCAELVFAAYQRSFFPPEKAAQHGLGLASVRAGNVIGGGDWAIDRIIPDAVRALTAHKPIGVRNPHAIRPWQHVLEPLGGYLLLAANLMTDPAGKSGAWNFGPLPFNCRTVREVTEEFLKVWNEHAAGAAGRQCGSWQDLSTHQHNAVHEAKFLRLCCDKAMSLLAWHPAWNFERTLRLTAAWYKAYYESPNTALQLCHRQIEAYEHDWPAAGPTLPPHSPTENAPA